MPTYVETSVADGVATLTVDRAERHNSLIPPLLDELREAVSEAQADGSVGALVLQTAGKSFSTGGDVAAFYEHRDEVTTYAERTVGLLNEVILALLRGPKPVVAAVDGQVTGGSLGLVLAADVAILGPEAEITPYYPVVGYSPDGGWTALLPEVIGPKRALHVLSTNASITPEQAVRWGIASELVETGAVQEHAQTVAGQLTAMKTGSIAKTKQLVWDVDDVAAALEAERRAFVEQIQTEEALEGMRAFLDT